MPEESFANAVRDKLAFLLTEHGFRIVHEDEHRVRLEAVSLCAEAVWDPRGEVAVNVFRRGYGGAGMWSYAGMVGKASVPRLLEIAGERMRAEEQVLLGDARFYEHLATDQEKQSEEWTDYYARKGPRPHTHQLPYLALTSTLVRPVLPTYDQRSLGSNSATSSTGSAADGRSDAVRRMQADHKTPPLPGYSCSRYVLAVATFM